MNKQTRMTTRTALAGVGLVSACMIGCQSQKSFSSPEAAVKALSHAVEDENRGELKQLFGSRMQDLRSGDPAQDRQDRLIFQRRLAARQEVEKDGEDRAVLLVGEERWPFAVPIVKHRGEWRFDTEAGVEEVQNRRIGRNELQIIEACRTVMDAQREYISKDHDGDGVYEYAHRLMSTEGTHDGLYWPTIGGVDPSPIGPALATAATQTDAAGNRMPYYGYLVKPLLRRGPGAPGGAADFKVNGKLTNGWAAIAYPAEYDVTGVMSFLFGSDGTVFEKDLGPATEKDVKGMEAFDPSDGWKAVQ